MFVDIRILVPFLAIGSEQHCIEEILLFAIICRYPPLSLGCARQHMSEVAGAPSVWSSAAAICHQLQQWAHMGTLPEQ